MVEGGTVDSKSSPDTGGIQVKDASSTPTNKKYPLPKGKHHTPIYAYNQGNKFEPISSPFWHPSPKEMPEAPVHFHQNAVNLQLHLQVIRDRLDRPMTAPEREWRKKYIMDQKLDSDEPLYVADVHGHLNPLRTLYRLPWDVLERRVLVPALGFYAGHVVRMTVPKILLSYGVIMLMWYHVKYNTPKWWDFWRGSTVGPPRNLVREQEIKKKYPGLYEKGMGSFTTKDAWTNFEFRQRYTHLKLDPPVRP